ncbi:MAG: hypothetical protein ABL998_17050 [Planctomycetota bacterium]
MSDTQSRDVDLDEDLFDFGGVPAEPEPASEENLDEIFASFREDAASEELLEASAASAAQPASTSVARSEPAPAVAQAESHAPAPAQRAAKTAPAAAEHAAPRPHHAAASTPSDGHVLTPAPRAARFSKGLVAIALSVTVLNAALAVVMLRSNSDRHDVRATEDEPASVEHASAPVQPAAHVEPLPDPESVPESHDHPTLDEARTELARGDHAAARQRVYGLLSIVDRLEEPRKSELEAECQYLIAQSLHLEALARMGAHE